VDFIKSIDMQTWLLIGLGIYLILPANSPIKAFLNKIIGPILGPILNPTPTPPGPGPVPGPTPAPGPVDLTMLLQLLMNILLKAKAAGDTKTQDAVLETINAVQAEQLAMQKSAIPQSMFVR